MEKMIKEFHKWLADIDTNPVYPVLYLVMLTLAFVTYLTAAIAYESVIMLAMVPIGAILALIYGFRARDK